MRAILGKPSGTVHTSADFSDPSKWKINDLPALKKMLKGVEREILDVYEFKDKLLPPLRDLESDLLKGARFL